MTNVLILGGSGMLGHKLYQTLEQQADVWATVRGAAESLTDHPAYAAADPHMLIGYVDAMHFDTIVRAVERARPDVVINCIGIIKQLREADDPILSLTINALLPHKLADVCAAAGTRLIHISTDCVFSGNKGNYNEDDLPDATDLYGRSKLLGELDRPGCVTLRTSIIGRDPRKQVGLLEWFLSQEGHTVTGFTRAIYSGFPTPTFARIVGDIITQHPTLHGLYQLASAPISKYDLLARLRDALDLDIQITPSDRFVCDRSMSAARFVAATQYAIPDWQDMITDIVADPTPYNQRRPIHAHSTT